MSTPDAKRHCLECGLELPPRGGCPHCMLRLALGDDSEAPGDPPPRQPPTGLHSRFFGDYEILHEISRGGMGVVYRARQLSLKRVVALKMIQSSHLLSPEARLRFSMEVAAAAQLNHPHIVSLYESGEFKGTHFFTMRLVEGGNLAQHIKAARPGGGPAPICERPPLASTAAVASLLIKTARAVHHAHQRGILHRDLKPSNILIDPQGEPHVADFGLAKMLAQESAATFTESVLGSPNYMAPEQAAGRRCELTTATDVYGLGAVLYEALTGTPPFQAATPVETIRKVLDEEPSPPRKLKPGLDADLETICLKCLQKMPAARYGTAEELAADLERWLKGLPIRARPIGLLGAAWRWSRRHPAVAVLSAALVVALAAIVIGSGAAAVRIHRAELKATANLRESLLGQTRMLRLGGEMGQRTEGLRLLREASALGGPPEFRKRLRDELLGTLALTDLPFAGQPQLRGGSLDPAFTAFDPFFERHAFVLDSSNIVVRRVTDGQELSRFEAGPSRVTRLEQFSHDGRFLGVRHPDGISIWDTDTGELRLATNGPARVFAFAPRKPLLALEEWGCQISLRELPGGQEVRRIVADPEDPTGKRRGWTALVFSADGRYLAAARAQGNTIELFEVATGQPTRTLSNSEPVVHLAWNPRQSFLAAGGAGSKIHLWDPYTGNYRGARTLPIPARSLAYSPSGSLLAAACEDRVLRLWQSFGAREIFNSVCDGHRIAFSPDGSRVGPVIRGNDIGWLELTRSAEFIDELLSGGPPVAHCQFSPDGRIVAAGWRTTVAFLDPANLRPLGSLPLKQQTTAFCFDPRGEFLLDADPRGIARRTLRRTNAGIVECSARQIIIPGDGWSDLACSAQGDWFAAANSGSNSAVIFDRALANHPVVLGPHPGADAVAVSPDGRWVATGSSADRRVKVWDVRADAPVLDLPAGHSPRAAFSADGKWLISYGEIFEIFELRETGTWRPASTLPFPEGRPVLGAAAIAPDGRLLAVVRDQYTVQLFDLVTFRSLGILTPPDEKAIQTLQFSPDGGQLVAGCLTGRVRAWDLRRTRQHLAEFGLDWDLPSPQSVSSTNPAVQRVLVIR